MAEKFGKKIDDIEEQVEPMMAKFRADYKHLSLLECILYANLFVFSIAASVFYCFYTPPNKERVYNKGNNNPVINIPVNIDAMRMPKKEIKKQLKKVVKDQKAEKETLI